MAITGTQAPGATELTADDLLGLKVPATTYAELNAFEAENILAGWRWATRSTKSRMPRLLTIDYLRELHRYMFGEVWEWAGENRQLEANVGVDPAIITPRLIDVLGDSSFWVINATYEPEELAIRLHHRVVQIHPFRNGNGRHARMMADLLLARHFRVRRLSWGGSALGISDPRRDDYLAALRAADAHDYGLLITFCTS